MRKLLFLWIFFSLSACRLENKKMKENEIKSLVSIRLKNVVKDTILAKNLIEDTLYLDNRKMLQLDIDLKKQFCIVELVNNDTINWSLSSYNNILINNSGNHSFHYKDCKKNKLEDKSVIWENCWARSSFVDATWIYYDFKIRLLPHEQKNCFMSGCVFVEGVDSLKLKFYIRNEETKKQTEVFQKYFVANDSTFVLVEENLGNTFY